MAEKIKFKCTHCGAELIEDAYVDVIKCPFCGTQYVEAEFRDEVIGSPYKREIEEATRLRNNCDFDEAERLLNDLMVSDLKNPEVYFQRLLLEYGITYVDENSKIRQVPIFNYIKKEPMTKNLYYTKILQAIEGDPAKEKRYKDKVDELEKLRAKVYDTYSKDEPYQVFISFKKSDIEHPDLLTQDCAVARRIYNELTNKYHLKVFFSEETLKNVVGLEYEPHIFSALYSAKVFLLICASPTKPEYLSTPWLKSEWQRFAKRYDEEYDNNLKLIPVFYNGFSPSVLPKDLKRFEGLEGNEEFYDNLNRVLAKVMVGSKKSQFQQLAIGTKSLKLKTNKEKITLHGFSDHKDIDLVGAEKTAFDFALANMKSRTKKGFEKAYSKLEVVTQTNKYNYDANLAKLKCDFSISFEESLVNASLQDVKRANYQKISKDLLATLEVADDEARGRIISAFTELLLHFYENNPKAFLDMLDTPDDLLLSVVSAVDKPKMLEIVQRFQEKFDERFKGYSRYRSPYNVGHWKRNRACADLSIHKLFKKYYSNYEDEGAMLIIKLLLDTARKAALGGDFAYADKLLKEVLEINEFEQTAIWAKYIYNNLHTTNLYGDDVINTLSLTIYEKLFRPFPVTEELPSEDANRDNLYYTIVRMITGGAKLNLDSEKSPFFVIFQAAMRMFNIKTKIKVAKEIIKTFTQMAESAKASDQEINYILMRSANRLLIEELYNEAAVYFKEVLVRNPKDEEAYWGLTKCDAKCPTNFSILFSKKDLTDLDTFSTLVTFYKENHPESPTVPYLDYYAALKNIKESKQKDVIKAFKYNDKKLKDAADPTDTPVPIIISKMQSGLLVSEMKEEISDDKSTVKKIRVAKKRKKIEGAGYLTVAIIISVLFTLGGLAAVVLLHPFIALAVLAGLWGIGSAILVRFPRSYTNAGFATFLKILIAGVFVTAVVVGRIVFIKPSGISPDEVIYFFVDTSEFDAHKAQVYHYISLGLMFAFIIAMFIKHYSTNCMYDDDIDFKDTFSHMFLIATWCYLVYSAQLLLGGLALFPSILGGIGLYVLGVFALLRDE